MHEHFSFLLIYEWLLCHILYFLEWGHSLSLIYAVMKPDFHLIEFSLTVFSHPLFNFKHFILYVAVFFTPIKGCCGKKIMLTFCFSKITISMISFPFHDNLMTEGQYLIWVMISFFVFGVLIKKCCKELIFSWLLIYKNF